jgi:hypothetical protein
MDKKKAQIKATKKLIFDKLEAALSDIKSAKDDDGFAKILKKVSKVLAKYVSKGFTEDSQEKIHEDKMVQGNGHIETVSAVMVKNNPVQVVKTKPTATPKINRKVESPATKQPVKTRVRPIKAANKKKAVSGKIAVKST